MNEQIKQKSTLASFIYLELIDMSFSFDGVLGAFAVRNLTILMVDRGTVA